MNIQEKIKELGLVPLFPDYYYFNSSKKNPNDRLTFNSDDSMFIQRMRFERPSIDRQLYVMLEIESDTFITEMHFVIDYLSGGGDKIYREDFRDLKFDNLPDVLNFFNEKYEIVAKVFNEMLLEKLKEELEEEKKKQEEQEQQEQEKSDEGQPEEGEKEEGEGEGESQEGEGEGEPQKGEGEGKPQKMSAKDIEKLLEELSKDQKGQSKQGQNDNSGDEIDLEDFLDKVEKGEAENDFTKGYKDKDLKDKIDYEKRGQQGNGDDMDFELPDFPEQPSNSDNRVEGVLEAIIDMLNTDREDIKRQFPTEKSAKSFVSLLSPNELDFIITRVGLPDTLSRFEKQKLITSNFITELENI
jgi:DNA-binding FrmR family transcriptional regulator